MAKIKDRVFQYILNFAKKIAELVLNDASRVSEVIKAICIISILCAGINLVDMSQEMKNREEGYANVKLSVHNIADKYRHSVIQDGYRTAELHSRVLRNLITTRIEKEYKGKEDQLKHDLTTYVSMNDMKNPLFRIFSEEAFNYERAWVSSDTGSRIIITDRRNVLFSTYAKEPLRNPEKMVPEIIFTKQYGKLLLFNEDTRELTSEYTASVASHADQLGNCKVLAPSYIFEHEDLLGVRDVYPDGTPVVNYKIAVIVAYNPITDNAMSIMKNINSVLETSKDDDQWEIIKRGVTDVSVWGALACIFGFAWYMISSYHKQ